MFKVVFFKFFLIAMYLTSGLMNKLKKNYNLTILGETNRESIGILNNIQDPNHIGMATNWVNPYITRYTPSKTTKTTTATTTTTKMTPTAVASTILTVLKKNEQDEDYYSDNEENFESTDNEANDDNSKKKENETIKNEEYEDLNLINNLKLNEELDNKLNELFKEYYG
jgi:hypothetical protein